MKTVWKKLLRDFIVVSILGGILVGFYFASLIGYEFEWTVFLAYIFLLGIVGIMVVFLYWSIKRKRESRSPRQIREVELLRMDDLISAEEHLLNDKIIPIVNKMGGINSKESGEITPRLTFEFHKDHKFGFLRNLSLKVFSLDDIILNSLLRVEYPISLSIKKKSRHELQTHEIEIESSQYFVFHTSHQVALEEIFSEKKFDDMLIQIKDSLTSITLNGKFVTAVITDYSIIEPLFKLITFIHDVIMLKDFGDTEVEKLMCYQCGDLFKSDEEKCDNCQAPRPTCIVCLLDMKPSEIHKVVLTPCCEVYAHRDHLISWLETKAKCPNCKKDLFLWLRTLKQQDS